MFKKLFIAVALMLTATAYAQEPAAVATDSKDYSETTDMLATAGKLVKYGYQTKTAMPLIQAIEIYNRLGVTNETEAKEKTSESDAVAESTAPKTNGVSFDVAQLRTDATKFADGDKNLLALIKATESATRGREGGATTHYDRVNAHSTDTYRIRFVGGRTARIAVIGDGDTDLDLYVYDNNGNFIASDEDYSDNCVVSFTPRWTGTFIVKIKNRGSVYNNYVLYTN